jgi:haloalkane dehalogenase
MSHYRMPLPLGHRTPTWVLPRQIIESRDFLAALETRLTENPELPVLLIWGDKDDAFKEPELLRWQRLFPTAETVLVPGVGHFAASEAPQEFVDAIRQWKPAGR